MMENKSEDIIGIDFQGWPIWKKTLREILEELGAEVFTDEDGKEILGFDNEAGILEKYPTTLEDDGMGYGINQMYITNADYNEKLGLIHIWRDDDHRIEDKEN